MQSDFLRGGSVTEALLKNTEAFWEYIAPGLPSRSAVGMDAAWETEGQKSATLRVV